LEESEAPLIVSLDAFFDIVEDLLVLGEALLAVTACACARALSAGDTRALLVDATDVTDGGLFVVVPVVLLILGVRLLVLFVLLALFALPVEIALILRSLCLGVPPEEGAVWKSLVAELPLTLLPPLVEALIDLG
jgi:uncharacterized BrkB/YihY/UPF0761 family membrane protein